ncbi:MAG: hypothetical protein KAG26_08225 [Methylococcales bacterium]|nr:hypothetical protein [Methylococcales bacterium]
MSTSKNTPSTRFKDGPVKWLLGRQLISGMRWIVMYALYGEKFDARDWMQAQKEYLNKDDRLKQDDDGEPCFWFDYIADSGDDNKATYTIACLCMSDLYLTDKQAAPGSSVSCAANGYSLPRGEFLFVGGDTAYHIADFSTLSERFQNPFNWAYEDIYGKDTGHDQKLIFGIPGNHDYYDALDGFNRQFCKPINPVSPYLHLKGFERRQTASYVALQLPFDWVFWGLDAQNGTMDYRQEQFFISTCQKDTSGDISPPHKLIVATPEPSTRFGQWTDKNSARVNTFEKLGLTTEFLANYDGHLGTDRCRLDISGDIHHYARYWGHGENQENDPDSTRANYASVVAGGGGAFLHASHTDVGQVQANRVYPSRADSHNIMIQRLLRPWNIFSGGYVWLAGALIILAFYFAVTIPDSSWSMFSSNQAGNTAFIPHSVRPCADDLLTCEKSITGQIQLTLAIADLETHPYKLQALDFMFAGGLLALILFAIYTLQSNLTQITEATMKQWARYRLYFTGVIIGVLILKILVIIFLSQDLPYPAASSILALLYVSNAVAILVYCRLLADMLIARKKYVERADLSISWFEQNVPVWTLIIAAIANSAIGCWYYGTNTAAIALTDTVTVSIVTLSFIGLILLAIFSGGALKERPGWFWGLIGLWHGILQLGIAFCMAIYSTYLEMILITIAIFAITCLIPWFTQCQIGQDFSRSEQTSLARRLFLYWVAIGCATFLAIIISSSERLPMPVTDGRMVAAFVLGAILSCIWFGWYLAVSLSFNGHNNEAGGGARVPQYRHMIRFKLTQNQLTGYVIGFDHPIDQINDQTTFQLVDVFTLTSSGSGTSKS